MSLPFPIDMTVTFNGQPVEPIRDLDYVPLLTFSQERDVRDLGPGYRRDDHWRALDSHGHEHRYVDGRTPTLVRVEENVAWCETCRDEHGDVRMACAECGDTVVPGMTYSMHN